VRGWTSPASGRRSHGWARGPRPVDSSLPRRWRWKCADCGALLEKSDVSSGYPTHQDLSNAGVDGDCAVHAARTVMES